MSTDPHVPDDLDPETPVLSDLSLDEYAQILATIDRDATPETGH